MHILFAGRLHVKDLCFCWVDALVLCQVLLFRFAHFRGCWIKELGHPHSLSDLVVPRDSFGFQFSSIEISL